MKQTTNLFDQTIINKAKDLVSKMTLEEKASLCSGKDFWHTKAIKRFGIPSIMVTDGPHGLRKQAESADHLGINNSVPATCFPAAVSTTCSFDKSLLFEMGEALGEECIAEEVSILLGPAANIKRSPLCGRNFEYISEDPYLTGETASALINGVQSKNIGTSLKHFLANNQEKARMTSNSIIDERALREIYLYGYEIAIKQAQPWTLMCAYNKINDIYASDNKRMMTQIPRDEWGFKGAIMTDWGAMNDRVKAVEAGLDLEMPATGFSDQLIVEAVQSGLLAENYLDLCSERMTTIALQSHQNKKVSYDSNAHHQLARRIARESAVLLKNEDTLPADKGAHIALIGQFAKTPRYQGSGSSKITPSHMTSVLDAFDTNYINYTYADGYDLNSTAPDEALIHTAVETAKNADIVFVFVGLPDAYESEGFDRTHLNMPDSHNQLIEALVRANSHVVAVIFTGSAVMIPWADQVKSILLMNLSGQNNGMAAYDLLFGDYSPCGKLAETYPLCLEDTPAYKYFGQNKNVEYRESIYVGYRFYDKAQKQVAYPFGFGLSYSTFEYSNLKLAQNTLTHLDSLQLTVDVKNTGIMTAKEIIQVYVAANNPKMHKPLRELKEYTKVELAPNETKTITFELSPRAFSYYNTSINDWFVENGEYIIEIGKSSRDIILRESVMIISSQTAPITDYIDNAPFYYGDLGTTTEIPKEQFEVLLNRKVPEETPIRPYTKNTTIQDAQTCFMGRILLKIIKSQIKKMFTDDTSGDVERMLEAMLYDMPLRFFSLFSGGAINSQQIEGLVDTMNGHLFKGLRKVLKK